LFDAGPSECLRPDPACSPVLPQEGLRHARRRDQVGRVRRPNACRRAASRALGPRRPRQRPGDRPTMAAAPPNVESGRCAGGRSCAHPAENRPVACAQLWEPPVVPSSTATVHSSPTAPSRALACRTTWLFARYPQLEQGLRRRTEITRRDVHTQRLSEPALGTRPCDGGAPSRDADPDWKSSHARGMLVPFYPGAPATHRSQSVSSGRLVSAAW